MGRSPVTHHVTGNLFDTLNLKPLPLVAFGAHVDGILSQFYPLQHHTWWELFKLSDDCHTKGLSNVKQTRGSMRPQRAEMESDQSRVTMAHFLSCKPRTSDHTLSVIIHLVLA